MRSLLQNRVDDMNDNILANDVGFNDLSLVVLGRDHVDVILEDLGLQLVFGLSLQR